MEHLVFLKLGGSVITDKDVPNTANLDRIDTIAKEIIHAQKVNPNLTLLLGHGSGSFGHHAAQKYDTRNGVSTPQGWQGFIEVAARARELDQIVLDRFLRQGINALSISPCSTIMADNRQIVSWDTSTIEQAFQQKLVPVIYGDTILDRKLGGIIFSTEELFSWLAQKLKPERILLAGLEEGVWKDFPKRNQLISEINPQQYLSEKADIQASISTDVTGGMRSKVEDMIQLAKKLSRLEVQIFSAVQPGNVYSTLIGNQKGTCIKTLKDET
jgi:isopentenyl phosphate kinase